MKVNKRAHNYFTEAMKTAFWGAVILYLAGCSTAKPAVQPQAAAPGEQVAPDETKRFASAPVTQNSSLDQLQQGNPVGTAVSSPLKDIYFDFDRYDLRADARDTLKADADWLKQDPGTTIEIEGHCDERGTSEYNLALGAKRAQAAKDYLTSLGLDAQRLSTISYGQEIPVCTEHNEDCWQKNRHDRFVARSLPTS